jgi:diadenosine tetraphosphate (Ap4A) HIT family hydrolase
MPCQRGCLSDTDLACEIMKDPNDPCLFCSPRGVTRQNALAWCSRDTYPVSPGHALIMPFRHVASFFDLTAAEIAACMELVAEERLAIEDEFSPAGYNIGVNVDKAGGQSVFHVHIHLIPRYEGDVERPQGGVRHVLPGKAHYTRK